ncbi:uncharacterized protein LOC118607705 [Rousettus aegyptiacus]|uniref:uncharacterized protein LOC118607705 n=1 Tax=Rousettus aegyptiacus TaxID=9407 RepID=UPI00168D091E|nr:uncharacterized protein LOC118607705 [Rousettus aegyptiacus]
MTSGRVPSAGASVLVELVYITLLYFSAASSKSESSERFVTAEAAAATTVSETDFGLTLVDFTFAFSSFFPASSLSLESRGEGGNSKSSSFSSAGPRPALARTAAHLAAPRLRDLPTIARSLRFYTKVGLSATSVLRARATRFSNVPLKTATHSRTTRVCRRSGCDRTFYLLPVPRMLSAAREPRLPLHPAGLVTLRAPPFSLCPLTPIDSGRYGCLWTGEFWCRRAATAQLGPRADVPAGFQLPALGDSARLCVSER